MTDLGPQISEVGTGKRRLLLVSSLLGAVTVAGMASICCVGPLLIALAGLGSYGFVAAVDPYRPWLVIGSLALLGVGFYMTYRPRRGGAAAAACGDECSRPRLHRWSRIALWVVTGFILLLLLFPYFAPYVEPYLAEWLL